MTWRDIQHIIVYTAVMLDHRHATWGVNDAGFHHSNQHGFGLLDAFRMTRVAAVTTNNIVISNNIEMLCL